MSSVTKDRIALVSADRQGSGYLLSGRLVLTSAHLLGAERPLVAVPGGTGPQSCTVVWQGRDDHADAALLWAGTELVEGATARGFAQVQWGRVDSLDPLPGCQAIGYPHAARSGGRPDTEQLVGTLKPGSSLMRGRYVLDSAHGAPAPGDGPSPWSGMSGAALFAGDLLVGVVCGDPVAWAHGRVEAVPVQRLLDDGEFSRLVERHTGARPSLAPVTARTSYSSPGGGGFAWQPVAEVDPIALGAHRVPEAAGLPELVAYVPRDADQELRGRLGLLVGKGGLLLVTGDSAAGKTRSLSEAMRAGLDGWSVCRPDPDADLTGVAASAARQSVRCVLWLDDLQMYLRPDGLTPRLLDELEGAGCVVLATLRSEYYRAVVAANSAGLDPTGMQGPYSSARVVRRATRISLGRRWTAQERERAAQRQDADPRLRQALAAGAVHGVAEYLAAGPQMWDLWQEAAEVSGNPRGAALVAAAVDLARTGLRGAVEREALVRLHDYYLEQMGGAALRPEPLEDAWAWATRIMFGVTSPLIPAGSGDRWRAFDYLVSATARRSEPGELPDLVWSAAAALAEGSDWELVWMTAAAADRLDAAVTVLTTPAEAGNPDAMVNLGGVQLRLGNTAEAENWWTRAAEAGEGTAAHNLGCLRMRDGDLPGARAYFRAALDAGSVASLAALGDIASALGDEDEAVRRWREGSERGDPNSAFLYAQFLRRDWRQDESLEALRRAAEGDHPLAALSYAGVLLCHDDGERAGRFIDRAYQQARKDALLAGNVISLLTASVASMALGDLDAGRKWEARYVEEGGELPWHVVDRQDTDSGLRALAVDDGTWQRLGGEDEVRRIMASLWAQDCMDCGYALGPGVPALHVDEMHVTTAGLYHFGVCRYPGWNDSALVNIVSGSGATWASAALVAGHGTPQAVPVVIVNPSLEQVCLEEDGSGAWRLAAPTLHTTFVTLAPFDPARPVPVAVVPDSAPLPARLVDDTLYVTTGMTTWWAGLEDEIAAQARRSKGFVLVLSHGLKLAPRPDPNVMAALAAPGALGGWISLHAP